ncbi:hypothetical protein BC477_09170 [Clavibacter michiganensis subsp. michiganensis]|uniref:Uncharacterized protein n=1 Tax=Clavibacter michiganensis subsp. michiganensis TaxID=33013 RepID=A0A251XN20_CLAMM|nr:hypothetical protein BC477_09170 [Clavibacter michiganensis subsp. michiganensis]OUE04894.1 hypothetical protein CMMCAS07_08090 [Clavibacter michiganensis subsp. michiganensis]
MVARDELGRPVVPPECRRSPSRGAPSGAIGSSRDPGAATAPSGVRPRSWISSQVSAPSTRRDPCRITRSSPGQAARTPAARSRPSSRPTRSARTRPRAPLPAARCASSMSRWPGMACTGTAPARTSAHHAMRKAAPSASCRRIRSPGRTPDAARPRATRSTSASSSAWVQRPPTPTRAVRSGTRAALRRRMPSSRASGSCPPPGHRRPSRRPSRRIRDRAPDPGAPRARARACVGVLLMPWTDLVAARQRAI